MLADNLRSQVVANRIAVKSGPRSAFEAPRGNRTTTSNSVTLSERVERRNG